MTGLRNSTRTILRAMYLSSSSWFKIATGNRAGVAFMSASPPAARVTNMGRGFLELYIQARTQQEAATGLILQEHSWQVVGLVPGLLLSTWNAQAHAEKRYAEKIRTSDFLATVNGLSVRDNAAAARLELEHATALRLFFVNAFFVNQPEC